MLEIATLTLPSATTVIVTELIGGTPSEAAAATRMDATAAATEEPFSENATSTLHLAASAEPTEGWNALHQNDLAARWHSSRSLPSRLYTTESGKPVTAKSCYITLFGRQEKCQTFNMKS